MRCRTVREAVNQAVMLIHDDSTNHRVAAVGRQAVQDQHRLHIMGVTTEEVSNKIINRNIQQSCTSQFQIRNPENPHTHTHFLISYFVQNYLFHLKRNGFFFFIFYFIFMWKYGVVLFYVMWFNCALLFSVSKSTISLTYIRTNVKITFTDWLLALLFFVCFVAKLIQIIFASFHLAFLLSGKEKTLRSAQLIFCLQSNISFPSNRRRSTSKL